MVAGWKTELTPAKPGDKPAAQGLAARSGQGAATKGRRTALPPQQGPAARTTTARAATSAAHAAPKAVVTLTLCKESSFRVIRRVNDCSAIEREGLMKLTPNAELLIDDSTDPRTREVAVRCGFTSPDQYHLFTKPRTDKGKATTWRDVLAPHCEPLALQATQPGKAWLALRFYFLEVHVKCHINGSKLDKPETIALLLPVSFDPEAAVVDPPASGSLPAPVQMHHMLNLWALAYRGKSNSPVKLEYQEDDQGDLQVLGHTFMCAVDSLAAGLKEGNVSIIFRSLFHTRTIGAACPSEVLHAIMNLALSACIDCHEFALAATFIRCMAPEPTPAMQRALDLLHLRAPSPPAKLAVATIRGISARPATATATATATDGASKPSVGPDELRNDFSICRQALLRCIRGHECAAHVAHIKTLGLQVETVELARASNMADAAKQAHVQLPYLPVPSQALPPGRASQLSDKEMQRSAYEEERKAKGEAAKDRHAAQLGLVTHEYRTPSVSFYRNFFDSTSTLADVKLKLGELVSSDGAFADVVRVSGNIHHTSTRHQILVARLQELTSAEQVRAVEEEWLPMLERLAKCMVLPGMSASDQERYAGSQRVLPQACILGNLRVGGVVATLSHYEPMGSLKHFLDTERTPGSRPAPGALRSSWQGLQPEESVLRRQGVRETCLQLDPGLVAGFFFSLLEGATFVQGPLGLVHSDLKIENILVAEIEALTASGKHQHKVTDLKIIDMDMSADIRELVTKGFTLDYLPPRALQVYLPVSDTPGAEKLYKKLARLLAGNDPEQYADLVRAMEANARVKADWDVHALGVILFIMCVGELPHEALMRHWPSLVSTATQARTFIAAGMFDYPGEWLLYICPNFGGDEDKHKLWWHLVCMACFLMSSARPATVAAVWHCDMMTALAKFKLKLAVPRPPIQSSIPAAPPKTFVAETFRMPVSAPGVPRPLAASQEAGAQDADASTPAHAHRSAAGKRPAEAASDAGAGTVDQVAHVQQSEQAVPQTIRKARSKSTRHNTAGKCAAGQAAGAQDAAAHGGVCVPAGGNAVTPDLHTHSSGLLLEKSAGRQSKRSRRDTPAAKAAGSAIPSEVVAVAAAAAAGSVKPSAMAAADSASVAASDGSVSFFLALPPSMAMAGGMPGPDVMAAAAGGSAGQQVQYQYQQAQHMGWALKGGGSLPFAPGHTGGHTPGSAWRGLGYAGEPAGVSALSAPEEARACATPKPKRGGTTGRKSRASSQSQSMQVPAASPQAFHGHSQGHISACTRGDDGGAAAAAHYAAASSSSLLTPLLNALHMGSIATPTPSHTSAARIISTPGGGGGGFCAAYGASASAGGGGGGAGGGGGGAAAAAAACAPRPAPGSHAAGAAAASHVAQHPAGDARMLMQQQVLHQQLLQPVSLPSVPGAAVYSHAGGVPNGAMVVAPQQLLPAPVVWTMPGAAPGMRPSLSPLPPPQQRAALYNPAAVPGYMGPSWSSTPLSVGQPGPQRMPMPMHGPYQQPAGQPHF